MKKIIITLLTVMLIFSGIAMAAEKNYKTEEVAALRSFMDTVDTEGVTNGEKISAAYDGDNPETYGGVFWQDSDGDGVYQVRDIHITGVQLSGKLEVSGFTQLNSLSCSGTIAGNQKGVLEIGFSQCQNLRAVNISHTSVTDLKVSGLPNLKAIVLNDNPINYLDIQEAPNLTAVSLAQNAFTQTSLPIYDYITEKQYQPQNILGTKQQSGSFTIGSNGCLTGLGAEGAHFTLYTEEGKGQSIPNPEKADFSAYKGKKIYLKIEKEGYLPLLTNQAEVTDGSFDYPVTPENQNPGNGGTSTANPSQKNNSKSPNTGVLPQAAAVWVSLGLLTLLIAAGFAYKKKQQQQ